MISGVEMEGRLLSRLKLHSNSKRPLESVSAIDVRQLTNTHTYTSRYTGRTMSEKL
jgi:hypothetical protein